MTLLVEEANQIHKVIWTPEVLVTLVVPGRMPAFYGGSSVVPDRMPRVLR